MTEFINSEPVLWAIVAVTVAIAVIGTFTTARKD